MAEKITRRLFVTAAALVSSLRHVASAIESLAPRTPSPPQKPEHFVVGYVATTVFIDGSSETSQGQLACKVNVMTLEVTQLADNHRVIARTEPVSKEEQRARRVLIKNDDELARPDVGSVDAQLFDDLMKPVLEDSLEIIRRGNLAEGA